jgi:hypothetical protein
MAEIPANLGTRCAVAIYVTAGLCRERDVPPSRRACDFNIEHSSIMKTRLRKVVKSPTQQNTLFEDIKAKEKNIGRNSTASRRSASLFFDLKLNEMASSRR